MPRLTTKDGRPTLYAVRRALTDSEHTVNVKYIQAALQRSPLSALTAWCPDRTYRVCSQEAVEKYLAWSTVDKKEYRAEHFDCDDFAASLRGEARRKCGLNTIAEVWDMSGGHAYSAAVIHDDASTTAENPNGIRVMVIEPQSDRTVTKLTGHLKQYKAERGVIIF